jgi:hypothetical protein
MEPIQHDDIGKNDVGVQRRLCPFSSSSALGADKHFKSDGLDLFIQVAVE